MNKFKNGDLVEAFFFPDEWVDATFIGMDGAGYVVRTVNGYKCSNALRKRNTLSDPPAPGVKNQETVGDLLNYLNTLDRNEELKFYLQTDEATYPIKIRSVDYFNIDFEIDEDKSIAIAPDYATHSKDEISKEKMNAAIQDFLSGKFRGEWVNIIETGAKDLKRKMRFISWLYGMEIEAMVDDNSTSGAAFNNARQKFIEYFELEEYIEGI